MTADLPRRSFDAAMRSYGDLQHRRVRTMFNRHRAAFRRVPVLRLVKSLCACQTERVIDARAARLGGPS
jgi:hypothetical protein